MPAFILLAAYLIGSFPTAYLVGRYLCNQDIRTLGDGNMGAGNAFRELGWQAGIGVFAADFLKGVLVVALARVCDVSLGIVLWAGIMAVVGHNWPVFLRFRGGRGEATAIGILVVLLGWPGLICFMLGVLSLLVFRHVTPASAVGFVTLPFLSWAYHLPAVLIIYGILLPVLVGLTHFLRVHVPRLLGTP